jgi:hypothetical protein
MRSQKNNHHAASVVNHHAFHKNETPWVRWGCFIWWHKEKYGEQDEKQGKLSHTHFLILKL